MNKDKLEGVVYLVMVILLSLFIVVGTVKVVNSRACKNHNHTCI